MSQSNPPTLSDGVADAVGFLGGALAGFWIGQWLGLDVFAPGYGAASLLGIAAVGLGGGLGVQAARRWKVRRKAATGEPPAH